MPSDSDLSYMAQTYAVCNGLVMRSRTTVPTCVTVEHVAFTLQPCQYPKQSYDKVVKLVPLLNSVVDRMSRNPEFLLNNLKGTADADQEFTGRLLNIFKLTFEANKNQYALAVHRSDYMLHHDIESKEHKPQQVELNTISSAFLSLSSLTHDLHEYLIQRMGINYQGQLVRSNSIDTVPELFAKAHKVFGERGRVILFVGQDNERNIADQKHVEHRLYQVYGIPVLRKTLTQLGDVADTLLHPSTGDLVVDDQVVSVVYYRAGYTPNDYPTESEWKARLAIERSTAIKCPNIGHHLVGTKKIQQVMYDRNVLSQFVDHEQQVMELMDVFTELYGLEKGKNDHAIKDAIENSGNYVLKPQREGGGNLIHGQDMRRILSQELDQEKNRHKYILMKRILPLPFKSRILRSGEIKSGECVAELGTFGLFLGNGREQIVNECGGYLLRTKLAKDEDGGVASGIASMDSIALI